MYNFLVRNKGISLNKDLSDLKENKLSQKYYRPANRPTESNRQSQSNTIQLNRDRVFRQGRLQSLTIPPELSRLLIHKLHVDET